MTQFSKIAFLFPGQGAQVVGMGKELYEHDATAREVFEEGDDLLKRNLSKIIFQGPPEELTQTCHSQPALFLVSWALLRVLRKQFPSLSPTYTAGLSLGEYTALAAAGKLSFQETLLLVEKRGRYMSEACEATQGTMAAILGLDQPAVEQLVADARLPQDLWAANFNSPGQTVISGTLKGVERGGELAKERGAKKVIPLTVHGAFHSGLMRPAELRLREEVLGAHFKDSPVQVVMNASGSFPRDLKETQELLISQVTRPVRWQECLETLKREGVDLFIEIGSGKTLTALNKRNGVEVPTLSLEKFSDFELLAKELQ